MMQFEIAVVGGGLAGSISALSLARAGRSVALIAGPPARQDGRTTALMDQSIRLIERLGLWDAIMSATAPLSAMQIIDGTNRLLRAPTVKFRSSEVGLAAFGYNMPNAALIGVLDEAIATETRIARFDQFAADIMLGGDRVTIVLDDGQTLETDFIVGADGRKSKVRESAGIKTRNWSYPQTALVMNFSHGIPHGDVSTEFHTESGPFTQVPLPGNRSSLVWVVKPAEAERLLALSLEELSRLVEQQMQSMLGPVTVDVAPQAWPLSGMMAERFGKGRAALVGEAAHAFPPIGAQGLNLSLRDVMTLTEILGQHPELPITTDAGDRFDRRRRPDIVSRSTSVDLLNRSLLSDFLPVQVLRAAGLQLLSAVPPLRNLVMREGIEPGRGLKSLPEILREKIGR